MLLICVVLMPGHTGVQNSFLNPNIHAHTFCATDKDGLTLKIRAYDTHVTPRWSVGIFLKQTTHHSHRDEIGIQTNFCVVVEITDMQP